MVVGVLHIDLVIHYNHSLKGKRRVLKMLLERVKNRFNVSIAEVGSHDLWQRAEVGITMVGNERRHVNSVLDRILNFIESMGVAEIVDHRIEITTY